MFHLCLIRHGETEANRDGIRQGHCDYPLTENGVQDAEKTGNALSHVNWTKIYASDLNRASRVRIMSLHSFNNCHADCIYNIVKNNTTNRYCTHSCSSGM